MKKKILVLIILFILGIFKVNASTLNDLDTNNNNTLNKEEITNPETGNIYIYITLSSLLISIISFTTASIIRKDRIANEI